MQPVVKIHFSHSAINVEVQQIHFGIELFQPAFYTFCYDVVGNAAERLYAHYATDAALCKTCHLARK